MERGISALGILVVLAIAWLWSAKRSAIQIHTVVLGIGIQLLVAATAFVFPPGIEFFVGVGGFVSWVLGFAQDGAVFLFGNLASGSNLELFGFQFALTILPILIRNYILDARRKSTKCGHPTTSLSYWYSDRLSKHVPNSG